MGLSEDQFLDMTPRQFAAWQRGENNRYKQHVELVRAAVFKMHDQPKNGTSIKRFWPLPWDEAPTFEDRDPKELEAFRERAKKRFQQKRALNGNDSGT